MHVFKKYVEHYERTLQWQTIEKHREQLIEELQNYQSLSEMKSNIIKTCIKNYQEIYRRNTPEYYHQITGKEIKKHKNKTKNESIFWPLVIMILIGLSIFLYEYIRANAL